MRQPQQRCALACRAVLQQRTRNAWKQHKERVQLRHTSLSLLSARAATGRQPHNSGAGSTYSYVWGGARCKGGAPTWPSLFFRVTSMCASDASLLRSKACSWLSSESLLASSAETSAYPCKAGSPSLESGSPTPSDDPACRSGYPALTRCDWSCSRT